MADRPLDIVRCELAHPCQICVRIDRVLYAGGSDGYLISHELFLYSSTCCWCGGARRSHDLSSCRSRSRKDWRQWRTP